MYLMPEGGKYDRNT